MKVNLPKLSKFSISIRQSIKYMIISKIDALILLWILMGT